jgi:RNA polymerase sigma-70 factor (ECF subfamily)
MMLSPEIRSVLVLKHLLGFSYAEISDILEVPAKTVKSRLYDGRERLRGLLDRRAYL